MTQLQRRHRKDVRNHDPTDPHMPDAGTMRAAMLRRVLRHLFTLCAAASLVLCVAVIVFWVRSYRVTDAYTHGIIPDAWHLRSARGYLELHTWRPVSKAENFATPTRRRELIVVNFGENGPTTPTTGDGIFYR